MSGAPAIKHRQSARKSDKLTSETSFAVSLRKIARSETARTERRLDRDLAKWFSGHREQLLEYLETNLRGCARGGKRELEVFQIKLCSDLNSATYGAWVNFRSLLVHDGSMEPQLCLALYNEYCKNQLGMERLLQNHMEKEILTPLSRWGSRRGITVSMEDPFPVTRIMMRY